MKGLVGNSPLGGVSFFSDLYAGSISDKELNKVKECTNCFPPEMMNG